MSDFDGTYVRVCPDCDAEYVSTVEVCHDCGATLETRLADDRADPAARAVSAATPTSSDEPPPGWVPIQTADLDWALELRERLTENGIAARLVQDCATCRPTIGVFVEPESLAAAEAVARAVYLERVPEAAQAATHESNTDSCPACGERVAVGAVECGECGLAFGPYTKPPLWA